MAEQVFLLMEEVWSTHNADTQCTVWGEGRPKGREEFLCLNFSCLAIKDGFYFTTGHNSGAVWGLLSTTGSQPEAPL